MSDLKALVRSTLKRYGADAATHFGVAEGTLATYKRTGKFPLAFVEKVLNEVSDQGGPEPTAPAPAPAPDTDTGIAGPEDFPQPLPMAPNKPAPRAFPAPTGIDVSELESRVQQISNYLQQTVDFYIRQFNSRISIAEKGIIALSNAQLRASGMPSLVNPGANVPVDQVFSTSPNPQPFYPNALNSGIAPTKEMVDAQANMTTLEGVPIPNASVAHPAEYIPNQPSFGFGWNVPRPPRR